MQIVVSKRRSATAAPPRCPRPKFTGDFPARAPLPLGLVLEHAETEERRFLRPALASSDSPNGLHCLGLACRTTWLLSGLGSGSPLGDDFHDIAVPQAIHLVRNDHALAKCPTQSHSEIVCPIEPRLLR
jgi:hypothetical protein